MSSDNNQNDAEEKKIPDHLNSDNENQNFSYEAFKSISTNTGANGSSDRTYHEEGDQDNAKEHNDNRIVKISTDTPKVFYTDRDTKSKNPKKVNSLIRVASNLINTIKQLENQILETSSVKDAIIEPKNKTFFAKNFMNNIRKHENIFKSKTAPTKTTTSQKSIPKATVTPFKGNNTPNHMTSNEKEKILNMRQKVDKVHQQLLQRTHVLYSQRSDAVPTKKLSKPTTTSSKVSQNTNTQKGQQKHAQNKTQKTQQQSTISQKTIPKVQPNNIQQKALVKTQNINKNKSPAKVTVTSNNDNNRISSYIPKYLFSLKKIETEVCVAKKYNKTYIVRGNWPIIRKLLNDRGWVEKIVPPYKDVDPKVAFYMHMQISELAPQINGQKNGALVRRALKSKLLGKHYPVHLYWRTMNYGDYNKDMSEECSINAIVSKFPRYIDNCTTKAALCEAAKVSHWYQKDGKYRLNHPRSYNLGTETDSFWEDYYQTAAVSLLKYIIETDRTRKSKIISECGKIPVEVFDFAVNECCKIIKEKTNKDLDEPIVKASEKEWINFINYFYNVVYIGNHFKLESGRNELTIVKNATIVLDHLKHVLPHIEFDGTMNIWILKPIASSRGRGIHICGTRQYILKVNKGNDGRLVAQKYIERPLLIYNTKFDIRQWFLMCNFKHSGLQVWVYKDCYLRFSSQTYNLRKLHESIHLTNNSVQSKYKKNQQDSALPAYNMWDYPAFKNHLSNLGYPYAFDKIIYPGMKQNILAVVLMNRDKKDLPHNFFELYGADFMLTEDFTPWLLEINSNPAMHASTPITTRLCSRVLSDIIKVVVDYRENKTASTGGFELIYKESKGSNNSNRSPLEYSLNLKGKPLKGDYFYNPSQLSVAEERNDHLKKFGREVKDVLTNLLDLIKQYKTLK